MPKLLQENQLTFNQSTDSSICKQIHYQTGEKTSTYHLNPENKQFKQSLPKDSNTF